MWWRINLPSLWWKPCGNRLSLSWDRRKPVLNLTFYHFRLKIFAGPYLRDAGSDSKKSMERYLHFFQLYTMPPCLEILAVGLKSLSQKTPKFSKLPGFVAQLLNSSLRVCVSSSACYARDFTLLTHSFPQIGIFLLPQKWVGVWRSETKVALPVLRPSDFSWKGEKW